MTDMRRVTVSLPDSIDKQILALRKDDRFIRCSYSEIVRQVLECGLDCVSDTQSCSAGLTRTTRQDSSNSA